MVLAIAGLLLTLQTATSTQSTPSALPRFEVASVRVSTSSNPNWSGGELRGNRYELQNATMLELIRRAYDVRPEKIAGGPSWLEWNRYDVAALAPPNTQPQALREMLKSLLVERFQLKVRDESTTRAGFALKVGTAKPALRQASSPGSCQSQVKPEPNGILAANVECKGLSMSVFAEQLPRTAQLYFPDNQPVVDETGIDGLWDFDYKFTPVGLLKVAGNDGATVAMALERIGLKLEPRPVTVGALVVDAVGEQPTPDPPDLAKRMPPLPTPAFEVASVRPSAPEVNTSRYRGQPNGQLTISGMPLRTLMVMAWNLPRAEFLVGPQWLESKRFDIIARASPASAENAQINPDFFRTMLQPLLVERFKIKYHTENRPMTAHRLTADKPTMTRSDPSKRTRCTQSFSGTGDRGASQVAITYTCTNVTMAQFAQLLPQYAGDYVVFPPVDATGLSGGWDFVLSFTPAVLIAKVRAPGGNGNAAIEPTAALTLSEAINRQLGLKLQEEERQLPVMVIDSVAETPTEN
jgi:uncharacterized protein (TIGR03435 family)